MPAWNRVNGLKIQYRAFEPIRLIELSIGPSRRMAVLAFGHFFNEIFTARYLVGAESGARQRQSDQTGFENVIRLLYRRISRARKRRASFEKPPEAGFGARLLE